MASPKTVWGIDIGKCALKALKLRNAGGDIQVEAFDIIEHPQILSQVEPAERDQLMLNALEQFLARNDVEDSEIAVAVPGQNSFSRFVKLPPVETKKIPDIVRFEAEQQIPFPMEEVVWRWQTFQDPDSPDVEVGIFAMKRTDVNASLRHFRDIELEVNTVQMAPLSLYNFLVFDEQTASDGATLLVDVGAEKTDLVVADGSRIWTRTITIGGNSFTEALVRAFKLSFAKAEKLKRSAASSKYARQVFQAMRPVFSDLQQEIQRSIGFYTQLHRETRFKRVVGLGNGFRLPGLQKFLEQNLNISVVRIDSYNNLSHSASINAPAFTENVLSFAVAYGLGVQALGEASVVTNLLPREVASQRTWAAKRPWFAVAAAMLLVALGLKVFSSYSTLSKLEENEPELQPAERIVSGIESLKSRYSRLQGRVGQGEEEKLQALKMFGHRRYWPGVTKMISDSLAYVASDQDRYIRAVSLTDPNAQQAALKKIQAIPRSQRRLVFLLEQDFQYVPDISQVSRKELESKIGEIVGVRTSDDGPGNRPGPEESPSGMPPEQVKSGYIVWAVCRTTVGADDVRSVIITPLRKFSRDFASERLKSLRVESDIYVYRPMQAVDRQGTDREDTGFRPGASASPGGIFRGREDEDDYRRGREDLDGPAEPEVVLPDPVFPKESMASDTVFGIIWLLPIESDGVKLPPGVSDDARMARTGEVSP